MGLSLTEGFLLAVVACVLLFDLWVYRTGRETISTVVLGRSSRYPILAFLAGLVCGHLFWPQ